MAKIKITLSKGPQGVQGPQGPQGPLGPAGPQGIQGQPGVDGTTIDNINDIDNVGLDLNTANLLGTNIEGLGLLSPRSNRYLTWDPVDNIIKLSEDTPGTYVITGASGSPSPGNQFVNPIFASTNGGNVPNVFAASGVISVNQSSQIPSSVNLYVNGNARFNGAIQVGDVNGVSYSLPSADGTAGQLLQTDGAGSVSFVSFSGSPWTTTGSDIYYNTGNVGIGTTTPAEALDVAGNIKVTGKISTSSTIAIGSNSVGNVAGYYSIHIGHDAGKNDSGGNNVVMGFQAGAFQSKTNRTSIGSRSKAGNYSVAVGHDSSNGSSTDYSVLVGNKTAQYTTGANNVAVGYEAGLGVTGTSTFANTVAVGYQALTALTTGTGNTAVGYQSGVALTTGANNTFLGYGVGLAATDRSNNVLIGKDVAPSSTTLSNTIAIGNSTLESATTAATANSVFIGQDVGKNVTTGSVVSNVWIGYQAGLNRTASYETVLIGNSAGTGGSSMVAIGRNAMNIGGASSLGIGHSVGANNGGADAVIIGNTAGQFGTTTESVLVGNWIARNSGGNYSVMMGHRANQDGTSHNSVHVGHSSGRQNDGDSNVAVGYQTISETTTGSTISNSVAVGYQALKGTTTSTASGVVAVGYQALTALTTGTGNTAVGYQSGAALTTASNNTLFGYLAGNSVTQSDNTLIGYQAGKALGSTSNLNSGNTFIGANAGYLSAYQTNNTYIGKNAAKGNAGNNSYSAVVIGADSAPYTTSGQTHTQSVMVGANIGTSSGNQGQVTLLGWGANRFGGSGTVGIGHSAAYNAGGSNNVAIGHGTSLGTYNTPSSTKTLNVVIGKSSGAALSSGGNNVFIGSYAGSSITSGSYNVFIGDNAGNSATPVSNKLYIENSNSATPLIYGEFDNDILRVNGTLQVNDPASTGYAFPTATGTLGQVLEVDANGDLAFATASGGGGLGGADQTLTADRTIDTNGFNLDIELDPTGTADTFTIHDGTHDLFQVDTGTTGVLFSVNDVSGLPKLEVDEDQGVIAKSVKADDGALTAAGQYGKGAEIWYQGTGTTQAGSACYLNSSGNWTKTNATNNTNSVGMLAIAAGSDSDVNGMVTRGFVYVSADPGGSVGDVVYLSAATDGLLTTTAPTGTTGFVVRVVGHKVGTNIIYFNPSNDWIELA